jgi:hypothetical protein
MKKIGFLILVLVPFLGFSCDHCNVYLNINPNDYQHSFGIQYRSRLHYGKFDNSGLLMLKHGGSERLQYRNTEVWERYSRVEITGKYFFNTKWSLQGVLPYVNNQQIENGVAKYNVTGIGDPMLLQNYQVFNTKALKDSVKFTHRLSVGAGVKIPLGSYNKAYPLGVPNIDLQAGTGSWDGLLNLTYLAKIKNLGVIFNTNYKLNTSNKDKFRYGNTLNSMLSLFYQIKIKNQVIMPTVGAYAEVATFDSQDGVLFNNSGGELYFADISMNWYLKKIRFQANYQHNFASILNDPNQLKTLHKINVSITYNI